MTAEQQHKQEWIDDFVDEWLCSQAASLSARPIETAYRLAEAAWQKYNEDGPDEMPTTDLGVWDLPRCEGGVR